MFCPFSEIAVHHKRQMHSYENKAQWSAENQTDADRSTKADTVS